MDALNAYFDMQLSIHGWIALGLGAAGVALLNVGLMYLATRRPRDHDDRRG